MSPYTVAMGRNRNFIGDQFNIGPLYTSGEIGNENDYTLVVVFNKPIQATNLASGVTIKKGGVTQTKGTPVLQADQRTVYYPIGIPAIQGDALTWEYAAAAGNITDLLGNALKDVTAQAVTNLIGSDVFVAGYAMGVLGLTYAGNDLRVGNAMGVLGLTYAE